MTRLRGIRFFVGIMLILVVGCTRRPPGELNGIYIGTDGASQFPAPLSLTIAVVGDGFLTGIWRSEGRVRTGQLSGSFGLLKNELTLKVSEGPCAGTFKGRFSLHLTDQGQNLQGTLSGNSQCADETLNFETTLAKH